MENVYEIKLEYNLGEIKSYFVLEENFHCKIVKDIEIRFWLKQQQIWIHIKNLGNEDIYIKKLIISGISIPTDGINSIVDLPEFPNTSAEDIMLQKSLLNKGVSFGSLIVKADDNYKHCVFGFLSSKTSRNYIQWQINEDALNVSFIYEFFREELKKGEKIILDPFGCYSEFGFSKTINNYLLDIKNDREIQGFPGKDNMEVKEVDILFTKEPNKYSLKINNELMKVKIGKKNYYPMDIRCDNTFNWILLKIMDNQNNIIVLKNIKRYIEFINGNGIFNVYKYIYFLILKIRERYEQIDLILENCPLGLQVCISNRVTTSYGCVKKPGIFPNINIRSKGKSKFNYNAILQNIFIRTLFQRTTVAKNHEGDIYEILDLIQGTPLDYKNKVLRELFGQIDFDIPSVEFLQEDVLLSIRFGHDKVYIILVNFSNKHKKVYFDASCDLTEDSLDGIYKNLKSDRNYFINNNKIYFKHVDPLSFDIYTKGIS